MKQSQRLSPTLNPQITVTVSLTQKQMLKYDQLHLKRSAKLLSDLDPDKQSSQDSSSRNHPGNLGVLCGQEIFIWLLMTSDTRRAFFAIKYGGPEGSNQIQKATTQIYYSAFCISHKMSPFNTETGKFYKHLKISEPSPMVLRLRPWNSPHAIWTNQITAKQKGNDIN